MDQLDSRLGVVEALPAEYAGRYDAHKIFSNPVLPLCFLMALMALGLGAAYYQQGKEQEEPLKQRVAEGVLGLGTILLLGTGGAWVLLGQPGTRLRRAATREIQRRSGRVVEPGAAGTHLVAMVPKSRWQGATPEGRAVDAGFLRVDQVRGLVLFEGDNERYRIPAGAIVKCEQDSYSGLSQGHNPDYKTWVLNYYYFVVVTVRVSEDMMVELPFRVVGSWLWNADQRHREANYELLQEILHLTAKLRAVKPVPEEDN